MRIPDENSREESRGGLSRRIPKEDSGGGFLDSDSQGGFPRKIPEEDSIGRFQRKIPEENFQGGLLILYFGTVS